MKSHQAGNAIVLILIAVFLFGALAAAFMRGGKTGQDSLSVGQAKLAAQEIMDYARSLTIAIDKLRRRGCSESQLNFASNGDPYHGNNDAPGTKECDIFQPEGGGITPLEFKHAWSLSSTNMHSGRDVYRPYYTSADAIQDVGTTCTALSCMELNFNLWYITKPLCEALNNVAGNNYATIPSGYLNGCAFWGDFACGGSEVIAFNSPELRGKRAVCYEDSSGYHGYVFNYVLMER